MADQSLYDVLNQCQLIAIAPSTRRTYQAANKSFITQFCTCFSIEPYPATSLTSRYFCAKLSQKLSYKTIKVYLSAIRFEHLERGLPDPTNNELLHMLCKGIKCLQGDNTTLRLPTTINIMCTLKDQLHHSHQYSLVEKRLLWSAFTVSFYGFLRASEFMSSTPIGATTLTWNDIEFSPSYILIRLRQSKTDPFRRGCSITLAATGISTCPCKAICHYANLISPRNQKDPLFSAGQFSPLMREHLITAIK